MARVPQLSEEARGLRVGSVSAALTPDASVGSDLANVTVTGNATFNAPTNPTDGQVLKYRFVASGGARTVSIGSGIVLSTGLAASYSVPQGCVLFVAIEYVSIRTTSAGVAAPAWVLTAATVSS